MQQRVEHHRHLGAVTAVLLAGCIALTVAAAETAVKPFNGRDINDWKLQEIQKKNPSHWVVGSARLNPDNPKELLVEAGKGGELINSLAKGRDIYSGYEHGDAVIELDVMVPQGSNSGIYVAGEYEIQVLDSYGKKVAGPGDMGAIYNAAPPKDPLYLKPGEWQHYEIHYRAPRFDAAGNKTANARFDKVVLNGRVIHENLEMQGPTPGGVHRKEAPKGPLMFQGNHGPVAFRNITIRPLN